jgi:hypothetical protein
MIKVKLKVCFKCNLEKVIWKRIEGKPYCKECANTGKSKIKAKSGIKYARINLKSDKQTKLDTAYSVLRTVYLRANPLCIVHLPGCTLKATEIHHSKGRGEYLLDVTTWVPICRHDHIYLENHPQEAIILGFSQSRLESK